ncbi:hypothetical protein SODALDRAFT_379506 [Sodiomyces alkalinus F11]|uniref:Uncharacterized protein n=1 Tax=Sodiomyces alkalinus (strain CBS 110278 / VKM F-3762 / F11) TaxID=1314773 RepID=A0A3N2PUZ7_SODAK|nr:hypothetical protein SODALDRAFT_379506 [Sodiomyces alkalinus F11]ROT38319.1 hypothetical protein SODALDRAFT_379506 [Sodiomyces alkalinus F11]
MVIVAISPQRQVNGASWLILTAFTNLDIASKPLKESCLPFLTNARHGKLEHGYNGTGSVTSHRSALPAHDVISGELGGFYPFSPPNVDAVVTTSSLQSRHPAAVLEVLTAILSENDIIRSLLRVRCQMAPRCRMLPDPTGRVSRDVQQINVSAVLKTFTRRPEDSMNRPLPLGEMVDDSTCRHDIHRHAIGKTKKAEERSEWAKNSIISRQQPTGDDVTNVDEIMSCRSGVDNRSPMLSLCPHPSPIRRLWVRGIRTSIIDTSNPSVEEPNHPSWLAAGPVWSANSARERFDPGHLWGPPGIRTRKPRAEGHPKKPVHHRVSEEADSRVDRETSCMFHASISARNPATRTRKSIGMACFLLILLAPAASQGHPRFVRVLVQCTAARDTLNCDFIVHQRVTTFSRCSVALATGMSP